MNPTVMNYYWQITVKNSRKKKVASIKISQWELKLSNTWHKYIQGWKKVGHILLKSKLTWKLRALTF